MMVKPAAVYGSEKWAMTEMDTKRLGTWERKILRWIYGPGVKQGIWRIRTNQEFRELYKDLDLAYIKKKRLEWTGHVRSVHWEGQLRIYESNPEGSRKGRYRLRWLEDVEKDLWEMRLTDGDRRQPTGKNGGP